MVTTRCLLRCVALDVSKKRLILYLILSHPSYIGHPDTSSIRRKSGSLHHRRGLDHPLLSSIAEHILHTLLGLSSLAIPSRLIEISLDCTQRSSVRRCHSLEGVYRQDVLDHSMCYIEYGTSSDSLVLTPMHVEDWQQ